MISVNDQSHILRQTVIAPLRLQVPLRHRFIRGQGFQLHFLDRFRKWQLSMRPIRPLTFLPRSTMPLSLQKRSLHLPHYGLSTQALFTRIIRRLVKPAYRLIRLYREINRSPSLSSEIQQSLHSCRSPKNFHHLPEPKLPPGSAANVIRALAFST